MLILLTGYSVMVTIVNPRLECAQQVVQKNIIKAEKFLYDEGDSLQNVLTGSSLVGSFPMDSLPGFYNMSFAGKSGLDGLKIMLRKEKMPKRIYLEMNTVMQGEDEKFTSDITFPVTYYSRKILPSLREYKHPIGILGGGIAGKIAPEDDPAKEKTASAKPATTKKEEDGTSVFDMLLKQRISDYTNLPDAEIINTRFTNLKAYVSELEGRGVEFVFFEMPVDTNLVNLPRARITRERFYSLFPRNRYHYIDSPDCSTFSTGDGVHLTEESLLRYVHYFKSHLK
ncbi:MAG: hypothetical protein ACKOXB_08325 [Flavobacteriales bacterium]